MPTAKAEQPPSKPSLRESRKLLARLRHFQGNAAICCSPLRRRIARNGTSRPEHIDRALGSNTVAIHWEFAREALQAATGMPTVVGLEADLSPAPVRAAADTAVAPSPQTTAE